jgi:pyruvate kinase
MIKHMPAKGRSAHSGKRTKIIATIGPASEDKKILTQMIKNGLDIARLNFSHGSYPNHQLLIRHIRATAKKLRKRVLILQDLQGPKIRVGVLPRPKLIKKNQTVIIGKDYVFDYDISAIVQKGHRILIEDGLMELKVTNVKDQLVTCKVVSGGSVQSHKGVNLPDSKVTMPILTQKDIADLQFGLKHGVDFVALSFVRDGTDIVVLKRLIKKYLPSRKKVPLIVAKIERKDAIKNFAKILKQTDWVMVARGDLGVELPDYEVPVLQKDIIAKCEKAGKPVIVATQMLDSMIRNPRPTRAEVSDVANAVIDHADAVMLSGETATGKYPVEAVAEMRRVIEDTEASPFDD